MSDLMAALQQMHQKLVVELDRRLPVPAGASAKFNQGAFDGLPALVSRKEFMAWTGYDKDELAAEVREGHVRVYRPKGYVRAKYYKSEIARLGGWKL